MRADVIPQLADAREVLDARSTSRDGVARSVLIPNARGLDHALELRDRFDEVGVFLSASETHNLRNVNRSVDASLDEPRARHRARARRPGCASRPSSRRASAARTRASSPRERVLGDRARGSPTPGAQEIAFGDTTGMANPVQVARALRGGARGARRRRRAHRALPQHARPGPRERARRAAGRLRVVRVELRRARRLPGAAGRDRQHRDRGPRLDAARDGHRDRHRPRRAARRRARGAARCSAGRSARTRSSPGRSTGSRRG